MYLHTGYDGETLRNIIMKLGNKPYKTIEVRCLCDDGIHTAFDELFGACTYDGEKIEPLDGDIYSLEDLYIKYEEWVDRDGNTCLTVWASAVLSNDPNYENVLIRSKCNEGN